MGLERESFDKCEDIKSIAIRLRQYRCLAWHDETIRSTNGRGKITERLMVVVSRQWLTERASSMQKHAYPIGSLMWLCTLSDALKQKSRSNH